MKRPKPNIRLNNIRKFVKRPPKIKEAVSETTSGGIVYRRDASGQLEILLIKDAKNRWTIPKGHVEPGEENGATAEREIREETGLQDMEVLNWLGKVNFRYRRQQSLVLMTMHIWLVKAQGDSDNLQPEAWLNGIKWFPAQVAVDKIEYDDIGKLMLIAQKKVREENL
ncbi:MAG: NUDIX domain-containing protein [Candidatus Saccharimonadales bacterium]